MVLEGVDVGSSDAGELAAALIRIFGSRAEPLAREQADQTADKAAIAERWRAVADAVGIRLRQDMAPQRTQTSEEIGMRAPVTLGRKEVDSPALRRLSALTVLDRAALTELATALQRTTTAPARSELLQEGDAVLKAQILVEGWAARVRLFGDGTRQILGFLLPGDLIGICRQPKPLATTTILALTPLRVCVAPADTASKSLAAVYAISAALERAYLFDNVARLGRLDAQHRLLHLLLELNERLELCGLASGGSFELPLTQEIMGEALSLTSVHVNRMVKQARERGVLSLSGRRIWLSHPDRLALGVGRRAARVSSTQKA